MGTSAASFGEGAVMKGVGDSLGEVGEGVRVGVRVADGTAASDAMGCAVGAGGVFVAVPEQAARISAPKRIAIRLFMIQKIARNS